MANNNVSLYKSFNSPNIKRGDRIVFFDYNKEARPLVNLKPAYPCFIYALHLL